jgi:hypothetical protein
MPHLRRRLSLIAPAALALAALAAPAQATYYSFASDVNHQAFTFAGSAASGSTFRITEASVANVLNLVVDDSNGPISPRTMDVRLAVDFTATYAGSTQIVPGLFSHYYTVTGSFSFYSVATTPNVPAGQLLFTVSLENGSSGLFTTQGTATTWSSTAATFAADSFADVKYTWTNAFYAAIGGPVTAAGYGILGPSSVGPDDFAFDLTALYNAALPNGAVTLDPQTHLPTVRWTSEGSYSGTSFVPAPGVGAAMGVFGAAGLRRRRR